MDLKHFALLLFLCLFPLHYGDTLWPTLLIWVAARLGSHRLMECMHVPVAAPDFDRSEDIIRCTFSNLCTGVYSCFTHCDAADCALDERCWLSLSGVVAE